MPKTLFLLGADDPEMWRIMQLLYKCGAHYEHASIDGEPVTADSAYRARMPQLFGIDRLVCIECQPVGMIPEGIDMAVIDHHRPGDPGYNLGPEHYWEAASIGQLVRFLKKEMPVEFIGIGFYGIENELRHIAASDHCPAAAMAGKCPGIDPKMIERIQLENSAKRAGCSIEEIEKLTEEYKRKLDTAPLIDMGSIKICDMTSESLGEGYTPAYLALRRAAYTTDRCYLGRGYTKAGKAKKLVITGNLPPEVITYFLDVWAPAHGLQNTYGVPLRGYAGGYYPR